MSRGYDGKTSPLQALISDHFNPDILLLQEVRDYDACTRLGDAMWSD
jgi:hypothetical protein